MTSEIQGPGSKAVMPAEYAARDFNAGPKTYSDDLFMNTIAVATGLKYSTGPDTVVFDLFSGPGKVAKGLQDRFPEANYYAMDASAGQIAKVPSEEIGGINIDVRDIEEGFDGVADVAVARYGIKDIPKGQQPDALRKIFEMLKEGGTFVVADMVSPVGMQEFNNTQHSTKQQLSGRNIEEEGECHIPTQAEWLQLLRSAGFKAEVVAQLTSVVSTSDWVNGKQITDEQRRIMDELLLSADEDTKREFKITQGEEAVNIVYPILVIKAVKPAVDVI